MDRSPHFVFSMAFHIVLHHHLKQNDNRKNIWGKKRQILILMLGENTYIYHKKEYQEMDDFFRLRAHLCCPQQ